MGEAVVKDKSTRGATYNLAGPEVMSRKELSEFVFRTIYHQPKVLDLPLPVLQGFAMVAELIPFKGGKKVLTLDQVNQALDDNVLGDREDGLAALGLEARSMEYCSVRFLHQYRFGSHFLDVL